MSFVLLDIGGTFIKCRLSDSNKTFKVNFPKFIQNSLNNIKEIVPEELITLINSVLSLITDSQKNIEGILICGQMHGWVITNPKYQPITNIVTWQDTRSLIDDNFFEELYSKINEDDRIRTGNEIKVGSPFAGITYTLNKFNFKDYRVLSLLSWVSSQITNGYTNVINITDAAAFSFADIEKCLWNKNMAALGNLEIKSFPKISNKIEIVGFSKQFECPVYTPIGDFQASLFGTELKEDEISINVATGGQVSIISNLYIDRDIQTRPYFDGKYLKTKTHLPAGRHANYILSKFRNGNLDKNWKFLNDLDSKQITHALEGNKIKIDIHDSYIKNNLTNFEEVNKLINYFYTIIKNYIDIVDKLNYMKKHKIVGSGGMISNSGFVRQLFEHIGNFKFEKIIINQDASLKGLELISKDI